jgi:hypothetical protein
MDHRVLDRDPLFTAAFRRLLRDSGVTPVRLPARSPNVNAFAERFVLSIKSECLERMVLLGEAPLRTAARQYLEHDHRERPPQGLRTRCSSLTRRSSRTGPWSGGSGSAGSSTSMTAKRCSGGQEPADRDLGQDGDTKAKKIAIDHYNALPVDLVNVTSKKP